MKPQPSNLALLAGLAALGAPLDYSNLTRQGERVPRRSVLSKSERDARAAKRKAAKASRRRNR